MSIFEYRELADAEMAEAEKAFIKSQVRLEVIDDFIAMGVVLEEKENEVEYREAQGVDPVVAAVDESY